PRFPPHTRGSTLHLLGRPSADTVSPAYAGIDPRAAWSSLLRGGFPRIRGDRPQKLRRNLRVRVFPPHTRGSTLRPEARHEPSAVSPAYAGIDRRAPPRES